MFGESYPLVIIKKADVVNQAIVLQIKATGFIVFSNPDIYRNFLVIFVKFNPVNDITPLCPDCIYKCRVKRSSYQFRFYDFNL